MLEVGGPDNVTLNGLVHRIEQALGKKARVRHIPLPVMRLSARLMRTIRPDLAGMIQAGIAMDTSDMTFDTAREPRAFPRNELTTLSSVIDDQLRRHHRATAEAVSGT